MTYKSFYVWMYLPPGYHIYRVYRCNRLKCPLARLSGLLCFNMGHNGHGINMYGVIMTIMGNIHAGGQTSLGHLSLVHRVRAVVLKYLAAGAVVQR